jgi:anti-anti-sigma factor
MVKEGNRVRLFLGGEIDMHVAPTLRSLLHKIIGDNTAEIVVDLSGVSFIDSSGVATLVEALRILKRTNRILRIENPTQTVRYTFEITQLTGIFGIETPKEEGK